MKYSILLLPVLAMALPAFAQANSCRESAKSVVSNAYRTRADINQDATQPSLDGVYQLSIFKNECRYNVGVQMELQRDGTCDAVAAPVLDETSANCG